ncbi:hypothetical protein ACN23B_27235 (plasmid) [Anabaena sp. FACHB-709]|uniref:Uncharacterized protein n=2 Tax=Nostocaceae TaxID=1162 RepID=A0A1Z4KUN8_ANAVA|nr:MULTISPECIES: hypothetical protein [Nostocaceae]BAY72751.1 hypothetical protein NIES23_55790 [Trichormus variabilis NIES-23]MBD2175282.1 hypothetical protein [Anabaena cylindrica FACHB-318]MBD2267177.1 hypothetical protein [Anabaena sp. FACHB-709]MBD2276746.1 hypothetical protein [Nostoc sp. PCC 7120 = FACHB-418]MBD2287326.1 hypothetical protein [Anabaena cylindrica FACHB-170]
MSNKDTFTRQELFELLSASYPPEKIIAGLQELAKTDPSIDPNGEEFDVEVSDRLERLFNLAETVIDQAKLLGAGGSLTNLETQAINKTVEQLKAQGISGETFRAFLEIAAGTTVAQAFAVHNFKSQLFDDISQELDVQLLQERTQAGVEEISLIYQIIKDPQTKEKIISEYGLKTPQQLKNEVQTLTGTSTPEFDPLKFFEEVGLPVEAKKSVQPKTIQDLRTLTQHLFKRQPNQATA